MKWFKHFSDAHSDTRIKRIIRKYGLKGYGLYFACIEMIANQLEPESPTPDLEENARDIAEMFGEDTLLIEEMLSFMIHDQKLFELNEQNGRLMCLKLLAHLDNTLSANPQIKQIISNFKKLEETSSDLNKLNTDKIRLDQNRLDEIRVDKIKDKTPRITFQKPTLGDITEYCIERQSNVNPQKWLNYYESNGWMVGKNKMKDWKACIRTWETNDYDKPKQSATDRKTQQIQDSLNVKITPFMGA